MRGHPAVVLGFGTSATYGDGMKRRKVTEDKLRRAERLSALNHESSIEQPNDRYLFRAQWQDKPEPIESRQRVKR